MRNLVVALVVSLALGSLGCSAEGRDGSGEETREDALRARADDAWFYDGPLPAFEDATVTVSIKGNTARVSGYVPLSTDVSALPHVRAIAEGGRLKVDAVYPIATARAGKSNSPPGLYQFQLAKPYRPDGTAVTRQEGEHWVTWGGYPFVAYNGGIAFHGPITADDNVWYLQRGPVSGGCNRMLPEHIVELTHVIGVSMRKVYDANRAYNPQTDTTVQVIADYDQVDGRWVDVDYPTWTGMKRPGSVHGAQNVAMFGSWIASETPDGSDLPGAMKWEGGVSGKWYVFGEHVREDFVCAVQKRDMPALKTLAKKFPNSELPAGFCAKRDCVVDALRNYRDARTSCSL